MSQASETRKSPLFQVIYRFLIGMVFGFANIIPGVSGGTAMVVFGVYERIILIVTDFRKRIRSEWRFFLPILIGMGVSILLFGTLMDVMLTNNEQLMQMFFIGVIVFSITMIARKSFALKEGVKANLSSFIAFLVMLGVMIWMAVENANAGETVEAMAEGNALLIALKMIVFGAIACATMIIPGISGSLVMVMLGVYGQITAALHTLTNGLKAMDFGMMLSSLGTLIPFAIGAVLGLVFCAKLIKYLLAHFERATYGAILGFVVGSIFAIFPGWDSVLPVIAFAIGGFAIVACDKYAPDAN